MAWFGNRRISANDADANPFGMRICKAPVLKAIEDRSYTENYSDYQCRRADAEPRRFLGDNARLAAILERREGDPDYRLRM